MGTTDIILLSGGAGLCILLGGLAALPIGFRQQWLEQEFRHGVIALGGGILCGAVALLLVPEGLAQLDHSPFGLVYLLAGGIAFFALERQLGLRRRSAPQLTGMLLDYLPETLALGGMIASGTSSAALLAALIGLQNLPEGFNAFHELRDSGIGRRKILMLMAMLVPLGPLFALLGFHILGQQPAIVGASMLFASGGILYLIFQDIAPQSRLDKHWLPPLGAVLGFAIAMLGSLLGSH